MWESDATLVGLSEHFGAVTRAEAYEFSRLIATAAVGWFFWAVLWPPVVRWLRKRSRVPSGVRLDDIAPADTPRGLGFGFMVSLPAGALTGLAPDGPSTIGIALMASFLFTLLLSRRFWRLDLTTSFVGALFVLLVLPLLSALATAYQYVVVYTLDLGRYANWLAAVPWLVTLVAFVVSWRLDARRDNRVWTDYDLWSAGASAEPVEGNWHDDDRVSLSDLPLR